MDIFTELAQYGVVGVCIALVAALVYLIKAFLKVVGNHINHSTEAIRQNTEVLSGLKEIIKERLK